LLSAYIQLFDSRISGPPTPRFTILKGKRISVIGYEPVNPLSITGIEKIIILMKRIHFPRNTKNSFVVDINRSR
jgi:hypothetical protein